MKMVRSMGQSLRVWEIPDGDTEICFFMFRFLWRAHGYTEA